MGLDVQDRGVSVGLPCLSRSWRGPRRSSRGIFFPLFLACLVALIAWGSPRRAQAYPTMIRHDYAGCTPCHADPSGAGLLTAYGRAQSEVLLSTRYGSHTEDEEASKLTQFAFGVPTPDWLLLGGWFRNAYIWNFRKGDLVDNRLLQMRADLGAQVKYGIFRASGTLGVNSQDSRAYSYKAWVTGNQDGVNLVSREHWAGVDLVDDKVLLRAGRINLPFGLRNQEHTAWVRDETRTDYNQGQEHGVAASWAGEHWRGEAMAILGNYQIHPDAYRERGYAGYAEFSLTPRLAGGFSSMVTYAKRDYQNTLESWRQAHGLFARYAPVKPLVLLAEGDFLLESAKSLGTHDGAAGFLQADYEIVQGVHILGTGEILHRAIPGAGTSYGGWASAQWFPFSHFDVRFVPPSRAALSLADVEKASCGRKNRRCFWVLWAAWSFALSKR